MLVSINKRTYQVPKDWNELTAKQLVAICRLFEQQHPNPIVTMLELLKVVTQMGWFRFFLCPPDVLHENLHLIDFLFTGNALTKNVLPVYHGFHGPSDNFGNLVMAEFVFTEDHFLAFRENENNIHHLDQLVAILYRPGKKRYDHKRNPDGDPRIPFNENLSDYNAKHIVAKWDIHVKRAILQWYDACRLQMVREFPTVFGGQGGDPARWGLVSMIRNVATGGVHGDFKEVEKQFVKMIMIELDEMVADAERLQKPVK